MHEEETYKTLEGICPYMSICSESNYGSNWICAHDKESCPNYYANKDVELSIFMHLGVLEQKILYLEEEENNDIGEDSIFE